MDIVAAPTNCVALASGLVSWWRGENDAGDWIGINPGTLQNGIGFGSGLVGEALNFDGSSNYVTVPASTSLNVGSGPGLTIECWIKPSELSFARPLVEYNDGVNDGVQLWISEPWWANQGGPGDVFANIVDTSGGTHALVSAPGILTTNQFHHVAVTYDQASGLGLLYADGSVVFAANLGTFTPQTSYNLFLGLRPAGSLYPSIYSGLMDEVSIYSRALATNEIQAIFTGGSAGKCIIPVAPFIISQPTNQIVAAGDTATFSALAAGTSPLSYQWQFQGTNLAGATGSALALTNVQAAQAGSYAVVVTNPSGSITSSNAVLAVNAFPPVTLLNVNFAAYEQVKTGLAATGLTGNDFWNSLSFPFQLSAGLGALKQADSTVTGAGLTVQNGGGHTGFSHPDSMYRSCCYAQDFGIITLTVTNLPTGQYDIYLYGHAGADTANTVFQLLVGDSDFGSKATATNSSWSFTNWVEGAQYVVYRGVTVTNGGAPVIVKCHPGVSGYTYLNGLQIMAAGATSPAIVSQPASQGVLVGEDATFSVTAGGTAPLSYQWSFNGTNLASATASSLTRTNVQLGDAGNYAVVVSNSVGSVTSSNAVLTVNATPSVTLLNVDFAAFGRAKVGFAATGQGNTDLWNDYTFPWQGIAGLSNLKQADGASTTVGLTLQNGAGQTIVPHPDLMYQVACYSQDQADMTLTVTNLPTGQYDIYLYGHAGDNTANTVFQLIVGGNSFGNQSTTADSSWSLTNWVEGAQYVVYRGVTVTNGGAPVIVKCHPGVSGYTYLNGLQIMTAGPTPPVIVSQPVSQSVLAGADVTFTVGAMGTPPLSYQWSFNGTNLAGATASSLVRTNVQLGDTGNYAVVVSNSVSTVISSNAVLTVKEVLPLTLLNVDFAAFGRVKVGFAGAGQTDTDFWNDYTFPWQPFAGLSNLKRADGSSTAVGLTLQNGAGQTIVAHPDLMYQVACYSQDQAAMTLTITNLPTGDYEIYLYGHAGDNTANTVFQLLVGGSDFGNKSTATDSSWSSTNWVEGAQYVVYRGVSVTNGAAPVIVKCHPGVSGYTYLNGLQIRAVTPSPIIFTHPTDQTAIIGSNVTFSVVAAGSLPLNYQWRFEGSDLQGATASSLTLTNVQPNQAGTYSVIVSNSFDLTISSNAVLSVNLPPCVPVSVGLVNAWRAEGDAEDAVGGDVGSLYNGAGFASGQVGQSFSFDGVNDHVRIPDSARLRFTNAMTIEAWVFPASVNGAYREIVSKWGMVAGYDQLSYTFKITPDGLLQLTLSQGGGGPFEDATGSNTIPANQWTHAAATYDGTTMRLYRNAVLEREVNFPGQIFPGTADLGIGGVVGGGALGQVISAFAGRIDEVGLYDRALSASEIQAIYAASIFGKCFLPTPPQITEQPGSQAINLSNSVTFQVVAGGTTPRTYQWRFNGMNLPGATNAVLNLPSVLPSSEGAYSVAVTNSAGYAISSNAVLKVNVLAAFASGSPLTNSVNVLSSPPLVELQNYFANGLIFYTLDGSVPSFLSTLYEGPFLLNGSATLRAAAYSADFFESGEYGPVIFAMPPSYSLFVSSGGGGSVVANPSSTLYLSNTIVSLTAIPAPGWAFLHWLGDASGNISTTNIVMTRHKSVRAIFGTTLNTTAAGGGLVMLNPPGGVYPYGTAIQLSAIPQPGRYFALWGNAASGNVNPLIFVLTNANPGVSTLFAPVGGGQVALTVVPFGLGRVVVSPRANVFATGTNVTITAVPEVGQSFVGWSGDASGDQNPLLLTLDTSKLIYANFTKRPQLSVLNPGTAIRDEGIQLLISGSQGDRYELIASTNLSIWIPLTTLTNAFGSTTFTDTATNSNQMFYRLISLP